MTLGLSRGIIGVTQREWSFLLLLWRLSDPRIAELREMPQSFSIKLHSKTQVSGGLGMSGGISPRHAQTPLSGERKKTLSITYHALSPPPSHHHLYIIHLINWLQRFYRIIMSLKRPFVPKSDVKQWFTTTTTCVCEMNVVVMYVYPVYTLLVVSVFTVYIVVSDKGSLQHTLLCLAWVYLQDTSLCLAWLCLQNQFWLRNKSASSLHRLLCIKPVLVERVVFAGCLQKYTSVAGVLGWLLVVVLLAPIRGGSSGICSVCWMLYGILLKH